MKINDGNITLLFDKDGAILELKDSDACITFATVRLNNKQVCKMLSRLSNTECQKMEVFNLDKLGKKMEHKKFEFEISKSVYNNRNDKELIKLLKEKCPENWESDIYFGNRDSFNERDNKYYATCIIRKWN